MSGQPEQKWSHISVILLSTTANKGASFLIAYYGVVGNLDQSVFTGLPKNR
jgi:hypothetical protein